MRVVTLIPWRPGSPERERLWSFCRSHLEALGFPLFLGDAPGPWARARACNAAAAKAGRWDIAVIGDADTIPDPAAIGKAVAICAAKGGAIRPHDRLYLLSPSQTLHAMRRGIGSLQLSPRQKLQPGGGLLVCSRKAWEAVGGFPEQFIGWGHEDSAMAAQLLARAGWDRIPGEAWHLFHQRPDRTTPERLANRQEMLRLFEEHAEAIAAASSERGWDVGAAL